MAPPLVGIHHLKFPVADIDSAFAWYVKVFGAKHLEHLDHFSNGKRYAVELDLSFAIVELRLSPEQAQKEKKFDPVTFAVQGKADLQQWEKWLDEQGVKHSPVLQGVVGWVLVFEDLDGRFLRLYTFDTHEKTDKPDQDAYWLG
ncbi:hypothetical protein AMS68_003804 [Peltaster fructicola]|uniref:VOC domain-containing protein n=1 Tax=Peltaster fructicola TaxID=286661 RepID=A0A6H0XU38_9PEZI|nr:hypothetical protein AMS68_003804 [Peltaster fructicola]